MIPRKRGEQEKERITGKGKEFQGFGSSALHSDNQNGNILLFGRFLRSGHLK